MKKILAIILLLAVSPLFAATWYATSSSANINATGLWVPTSTGTCTGSGTALVWGSQANGDVFDTNGCVSITVNVDPGVATGASANVCGSVTVKVKLQDNTTTSASSGFLYATASNLVIHADVAAGKQNGLAITGSTGGGTICGNISGSTVANSGTGVSDTHTAVMVYVVGNLAGQSGANSAAYTFAGNTDNEVTITGNVSSGTAANADGLDLNSNGSATVNGSCIGTDTSYSYACSGSQSANGTVNVNGNIVNGKTGLALANKIIYVPSPTKTLILPADSSYALANCWSAGAVTVSTCTHAIVMTMPPNLTCPTGCTTSTNSSVTNGVTFGPYTGSAASGGVSAAESW